MKPRSLSDDKIQQICILLAEHEKPQAQIADLMGVSPATVHRAVRIAEQRGWFRRRVEVGQIDRRNELAVQQLLNIDPLRALLQERERKLGWSQFRELHVFANMEPSRREQGQGQSYAERLRTFARPAAALLARRLSPLEVQVIGVSWGAAIKSVLGALDDAFPSPPRAGHPVACVPIAGSPPDADLEVEVSSSHLAAELNRILNGKGQNPYTFSVGAWVPAAFPDEEAEVIRRFCFTSSSYKRVFSAGGLIEDLSCVITSIGAITEFAGPWLEAGAKAGGLSPSKFSQLTLGNISGWFLPRPGISDHEREVIDRVNGRWLGITQEHLRRCATAGALGRSPGVVLIALGKRKAEVVLEAIDEGLVNMLIADQSLLDRLRELTGAAGS